MLCRSFVHGPAQCCSIYGSFHGISHVSTFWGSCCECRIHRVEHTLDTPEHVTGTAWEHQSTAEAQTALRLCYGLGTALQEQQALRQALQQLRNQNPDTVLRAR